MTNRALCDPFCDSNTQTIEGLLCEFQTYGSAVNFWTVYLDEAYTRFHYRIGAVIIRPAETISAVRELRGILENATRAFDLGAAAELHGYDIFHGAHAWEPALLKTRARVGVYVKAVNVVVTRADAIVVCGDQLDGKPGSPRDRHREVMRSLISAVDTFARVHDGHVLLIADEHEMRSDLCSDLLDYQREHSETRVIDTIHFVSSATSPLVQAADLLTYVSRRVASGEEKDPRAKDVNEKLIRLIDQRRWHPEDTE